MANIYISRTREIEESELVFKIRPFDLLAQRYIAREQIGFLTKSIFAPSFLKQRDRQESRYVLDTRNDTSFFLNYRDRASRVLPLDTRNDTSSFLNYRDRQYGVFALESIDDSKSELENRGTDYPRNNFSDSSTNSKLLTERI